MSLIITNTLASVQIVFSAGPITTVKPAPQKETNARTAESYTILLSVGNLRNRHLRRHKPIK